MMRVDEKVVTLTLATFTTYQKGMDESFVQIWNE